MIVAAEKQQSDPKAAPVVLTRSTTASTRNCSISSALLVSQRIAVKPVADKLIEIRFWQQIATIHSMAISRTATRFAAIAVAYPSTSAVDRVAVGIGMAGYVEPVPLLSVRHNGARPAVDRPSLYASSRASRQIRQPVQRGWRPEQSDSAGESTSLGRRRGKLVPPGRQRVEQVSHPARIFTGGDWDLKVAETTNDRFTRGSR